MASRARDAAAESADTEHPGTSSPVHTHAATHQGRRHLRSGSLASSDDSSGPSGQGPPEATTYAVFFAQARMPVDGLVWALLSTLCAWLACARVLQHLSPRTASGPSLPAAVPRTPAANYYCQPGPLGAEPWPHCATWPPPPTPRCLADHISGPGILDADDPVAASAPAGQQAAAAAGCFQRLLRRVLGAAQSYTHAFTQVLIVERSLLLPVACLLVSCSLATLLLRPGWYMRGGRTLLLVPFVLATRAAQALELLMAARDDARHHVPAAVAALRPDTSRAATVMLLQAVLLPLPGVLQLQVSLASFLLIVITEAVLHGPSPSPAHLLFFAIRTFAVGIALPAPFMWLYERTLKEWYMAEVHGGGTGGTGSTGAATWDKKQAAQPATRGRLPSVPYRRCCGLGCRVGVKVHHHEAFSHRNAIRDELEAYLRTHLNAHQQAAPAPLDGRPPPVVTALSTMVVQGCLQLLVTAHAVPVATAGVAATSARQDGGGGMPLVPEPPQGVVSAADLVQGLQGQLGAVRDRLGCRVTVSSTCGGGCKGAVMDGDGWKGGVTVDDGMAVARLDAQAVTLRVAPPCMEAGVRGAQEVVVELRGLPAWVVGRDAPGAEVLGAEVVASCWIAGRAVAVREPLVSVWEGAGAGGAEGVAFCRLLLPAHLDAAPVEVHLVATCPSHEGMLLASTTTMALPRRAACQLLAALPADASSSSQIMSGVLDLLEDAAVAWKLLRPPPLDANQTAADAAAAAGMASVAHMKAYCATAGLPALAAFLQQLRPAIAGSSSSPAGHANAAAIATATAGACADGQAAGTSQYTTTGAAAFNSGDSPADRAPTGSDWEERYFLWQLQQGRALDLLPLLAMLVLGWWAPLPAAAHVANDPSFWAPRPLLDVSISCMPWLVLALGPAGMRRRRRVIIALQSAVTAAWFLAAAACVEPQQPLHGAALLGTLAGAALYLPLVQQVGWKQQLLSSFFLREIPRHIMLRSTAAAACTAHPRVLDVPSILTAAMVSGVASAVAWAVDRCRRATFTATLASGAGGAASSGKQKAH